jgi:hypothetical protein
MDCKRISMLLIAGLLTITISAWSGTSTERVRLVRQDQTIDVVVDGQLFTTYHFADDFIRPYVRPFFWPVNAADGTSLTVDQAQTVRDHPHQRSIWIGHADVNGADHWKITHKPIQPKQRHVDLKDASDDGFTEDLIWEDKDGQPMLGEARSFRFLVYPDNSRGIDIQLRLNALSADVTFGMARDHGLLAVRMVPAIADHPQLLNSSGADTDQTVSYKRADWCDESGQIDGKIYGVTVFDSPENVRHPPYWHASTGTHIGPDIVGPGKSGAKPSKLTDDSSGAPTSKPDAGPLTIKFGQTLSLHYRLIFHEGDGKSAELARKYTDFISGK